MHTPSTGLSIEQEAPRLTLHGHTLAGGKGISQHHAAGRQAHSKSKGMGALRLICAEILPPEAARATKATCAAGLKGFIKHRLVDTLKRHLGVQLGLSKSHYAGCEAYPIDAQSVHPTIGRGSFDAAGVGYASSKNSTNRPTLVDNMRSGGAVNDLDSVLSLGNHIVLEPSRNRSWARLDCSDAPSRERLDSGVSVTRWGQGLQHGTGMVAPHAILGLVAGGVRELDCMAGRRFALRRNAHLNDVLEVVDCQTVRVAYRRIVQHGKRWCASFHGVSAAAAPAPSHRLKCATLDHVGLLGALPLGGATSSFHVDRCNTSGKHTVRLGALIVAPSLRAAPNRMQGLSAWQMPGAWQGNPLWEISSPQPGVFPLHCRDVRGALNPVPLTPMVCDRHQFCYRFYLAGTKMRWQARRRGRTTTELQCFVRSSVVALLLFAEHTTDVDLHSTNQSDGYPSSANHASVVILPAAFARLPAIDSAIVESFVLFTGIEVFQCFLYTL